MEIGGERAGEHTLLVAEHYSRAEEPSLAAAQLTKAGERGLQLATFEEAATLLERARGMLARPEHTEQRLGIELLRAELEAFCARYPNATEILQAALQEARGIGNVRLQAKMLGQLGRIAMWQGDVPTALRCVGEALEASRAVGDKAALIFNLRQMGNMTVQTDPDEARKYHEESVELARQAGDRSGESHGLNSLGIAYQLGDRPEEAKATFLRALEINRGIGNIASLFSAAGDLDGAERAARESMAIIKEIGVIGILPTCEAALAEVSLRRGRDGEAREWIRKLGQSLRTLGISPIPLAYLYGILKLRTGDRPKGLAWLGYSRAHDPNRLEISLGRRSFQDLIRGDATEEEVEAAMKAGESLALEEILAEAETE
jgi:tetratricopeptide (TPR) repeat protein